MLAVPIALKLTTKAHNQSSQLKSQPMLYTAIYCSQHNSLLTSNTAQSSNHTAVHGVPMFLLIFREIWQESGSSIKKELREGDSGWEG